MALEIERKFLVAGEYKPFAVSHSRITQGYISSASGRTVRVRILGDKGYLTIKGPALGGNGVVPENEASGAIPVPADTMPAHGPSGFSRFEWEKEISVEEAEALMALCEPGVIDKTRWLVPAGDGVHTWEVDEFHGDNDGLVMAEIELRSEDDTFEKPSWLGEEVTGDRRYYNSMLSKYPYKSWK
ncbi:MAG: CYTH domain-containing protein [Bacteroidales bacterium]|nr:CYTH domain-containing protein [Bacteroidales bacterium]